jgi:ADP-heptose:LPS heptosyltransferase
MARTVAVAVLYYLRNRIFHKQNKNEKNVLILFQQVFGDAVLVSDSLKYYEKLYPPDQGYTVTFVCKPAILKFMKEVVMLPKNIKYEVLDFKRIQTDVAYFHAMIKKYGTDYGVVIVPGTSYSAELFSICSTASIKKGLLPSIPRTNPRFLVWLQKKAYTSIIRPDKDLMMLQRHRLLLNRLGLDDVKARLPRLLPQLNSIREQYCVICPGSSMDFKIWPMERFASVADYVIEKYALTVYLCGGSGEEKFAEKIKLLSKYPEKIISRIGNTAFAEWSALVQYARLVIGNDSATLHLAAAARTPAICIAGVYDKFQFFPYKVDVLEDGDFLPITIYKEMPCEWCRTIGYEAGYGNKKCRKRISENKCVCCIDKITVDEVLAKVDEVLNNEVI